MKKLGILAVAVLGLGLILCQPAQATTMADLLGGGTITVGTLTFGDFENWSSVAAGAGAVAVAPSDIIVSPLITDNGEVGLIFQGAMMAFSGQTKDVHFSYIVSAAPGYFIHDNTLQMTANVFPAAFVTVIEDAQQLLGDDPLSLGAVLAHKSNEIIAPPNPAVPAVLTDHEIYSINVPSAYITKDILMTAGTGVVILSDFTQTFSVVPEPVTMFSGFMAISGLGVYIRRRMKVTA
jgi:hypothetical protein